MSFIFQIFGHWGTGVGGIDGVGVGGVGGGIALSTMRSVLSAIGGVDRIDVGLIAHDTGVVLVGYRRLLCNG
jgi:hypothetical protein